LSPRPRGAFAHEVSGFQPVEGHTGVGNGRVAQNLPCGPVDAAGQVHRKNSGFGLVTIDPDAKTYTLDCFKFLCDATDGKASNQYPGWPITIHQAENKGENRIG